MTRNTGPQKKSFWTSMPGGLTRVAVLITVAAGLIGGLATACVPEVAPTVATSTTAATPTAAVLLAEETEAPPMVASTAAPTESPTTSPVGGDTREATIWALAYQSTATGAEGICHAATITVRHKDEPGLRVGFFNENVEGTGPMWRASGWTAEIGRAHV